MHVSVMLKEALELFKDCKLRTFYEGTVGAGGHAKAFLEQHPEIKHYFACDADPEALKLAKKTLEPWKKKVEFVHGNFSELDSQLKEYGIREVDGFFLI